MNRQLPALLAVAFLAAAAGYLAARHLGTTGSAPAVSIDSPGGLEGERRPGFSHTGLDGRVLSADELDGQVVLLNFWATWCAPCVEEMPMLSALQDEYRTRGFRVVGIALDEPERAAAFARELGVSYPIVVGEADVVVTSRRYGNTSGMLPYSVLIDTDGVVRWTRLGALERPELESRLRELTTAR